MYAEFTEVIKSGIELGRTRKVVVNLDKVISFRASHDGNSSWSSVLETRRGDFHVEETYDQLKKLFNNKNGMAPVLLPVQ
tara:strand:+ start:195 stop:434 length:240 start_codon:yes stop_codon:yes gene_type:complete